MTLRNSVVLYFYASTDAMDMNMYDFTVIDGNFQYDGYICLSKDVIQG